MKKVKGDFPRQSETSSIVEQVPPEHLEAFVESLRPLIKSPEEAALWMYRQRPSEIGRKRLLEMGIVVD